MSNHLLSRVWAIKDMPLAEKCVLARLADRANGAGIAYPGQTSLARECGVTGRCVAQTLQKLVSAGHLEILSPATFSQPAKYRVTPRSGVPAEADSGAEAGSPPEPGSAGNGSVDGEVNDVQEVNDVPFSPERRSAPLPNDVPTNPKGTQRNPQGGESARAGEPGSVRVPIRQAGAVVAGDTRPPQTSGVVNAAPAVPPPTMEEAVSYGERSGITRDCSEKWFLDCEARGWTDRAGQPISRWTSSLLSYGRSWRAREGQARAASGAAYTPPRRAVGASREPLTPAQALKI